MRIIALSVVIVSVLAAGNYTHGVEIQIGVCLVNHTSFTPNYYEQHPNLLIAGLRLVTTGEESSDFSLMVYHKKSTPYQVMIENIKERPDDPYLAIRLFLKSNKTMFVFYESKSDQTIMATYQLRGDLVHVASHSHERIPAWRITDSEDGFYDAATCELFTGQRLRNCQCQVDKSGAEYCMYDYLRKSYAKLRKWEDPPAMAVFNYYNCMYFHESRDQTFVSTDDTSDWRKMSTATFISSVRGFHNGDEGICIAVERRYRQVQLYDLKWDVPGQFTKQQLCDIRYVAKRSTQTLSLIPEPWERKMSSIEPTSAMTAKPDSGISKPQTTQSSEQTPSREEENECWPPLIIPVAFVTDGLLFLVILCVCLVGCGRRNVRQRLRHPKRHLRR